MHLPWLCATKQKIAFAWTRTTGQTTDSRRNDLLLDTPPGVRRPSIARQPTSTACRDPKHRAVPLANRPAWSRGVLTPPRAGNATLPDDVWRLILDDVAEDAGDLLSLRQTNKYFARLVDADHAAIFAAQVVPATLRGELAMLEGRCLNHLYASLSRLDWTVQDAAEQARLDLLMPRLVGLKTLKLRGTDGWRVHLSEPWPPRLVALSLDSFVLTEPPRTPGTASVATKMPSQLELLLCSGGAFVPAQRPQFPPGLRGLMLRDCALDDDVPLDLSKLSRLRELDLTYNGLVDGSSIRVPSQLSRQHQRAEGEQAGPEQWTWAEAKTDPTLALQQACASQPRRGSFPLRD